VILGPGSITIKDRAFFFWADFPYKTERDKGEFFPEDIELSETLRVSPS
jgi:hypothetical protein